MSFQRELEVALDAAGRAGRLILEHYASFEVVPDAPADISTDTDKQSQAIILACIHEAFPNDALCAEETITALSAVPRTGPRVWVVDPIDGTRGFARKTGEFSVMVGFVVDGRPVVGVVLEPATERLTYAQAGQGCWRRDGKSAEPVLCHATGISELSLATITQSHSKKGSEPSPQIRALKPKRVIETYSAGIKLAQVARGEADIYLNTYDACHDWDLCAGQIILEEAGGRVTNLLGAEPRYAQARFRQENGLLAANGHLHAKALAVLNP
jgi:3'(2'), 5'-bisphosphate nucleotidase